MPKITEIYMIDLDIERIDTLYKDFLYIRLIYEQSLIQQSVCDIGGGVLLLSIYNLVA